jgi:hypothetical protein
VRIAAATFCYVWVSLFVVFFWRGTWALLDEHLFPDDPSASAWACVVGGYTLFLALMLVSHDATDQSIEPKDLAATESWTAHALRMAHTYIAGVCGVLCWRGVWMLLDQELLTSSRNSSAWVSHAVGVIVLALSLHLQSVLAAPVVLLADRGAAAVRFRGVLKMPFCMSSEARATR